ncbi:hypothetical protein D3C87_2086690 [compost metagenome]
MMAMTSATLGSFMNHNTTGMTSVATSADSEEYLLIFAVDSQTAAKTRTIHGATPSKVPI